MVTGRDEFAEGVNMFVFPLKTSGHAAFLMDSACPRGVIFVKISRRQANFPDEEFYILLIS